MHSSTARTSPLPNIERQLIDDMPAVSTALRARKPTVDLDQVAPIPCGFIGQLPDQFPPTRIANRASQLMVSHHILHCQVLNRDGLVFSHQSSRQLMQKILSSVRDRSVNFCNLQSRFIPIVRPFHLADQSLLPPSQLLTKSIEVLWVRDLCPCTQSQQTGNAQVNSDRLHRHRKGFGGRIIHQQRDKPSSRSIQFHRNGTGSAPLGQLSAPTDGQSLGTFSQENLPVLPAERRLGKLSRATIALFLEVRVLGSTCPEIAKRLLQVSQSLLQGYAAHFIEELKVFFLLPQRELSGRLNIVHSLLPFVPSLRSVRQGFVVNQPHTAQCPPEQEILLRGWVNSVLKSSFHPHIIENILESLGVSNP